MHEFDSHLHNFRMVLITKGVLYEKYSKYTKIAVTFSLILGLFLNCKNDQKDDTTSMLLLLLAGSIPS
ncbi:Uncharacterized protein XB16_3601 [Leptospira santarosai]|uniref:Uncharacterized protein n=1 Tax=Leptospira santarosai TaxID=28183 RepID=A0A2P1QYR3_9LEPT|nr:Uncharacterized protein XB16_3601 [Leptospira santarosai]